MKKSCGGASNYLFYVVGKKVFEDFDEARAVLGMEIVGRYENANDVLPESGYTWTVAARKRRDVEFRQIVPMEGGPL